MDDRWAYPIPMTMQRQAGSAPKPRSVKSPPVAPAADDNAAASTTHKSTDKTTDTAAACEVR